MFRYGGPSDVMQVVAAAAAVLWIVVHIGLLIELSLLNLQCNDILSIAHPVLWPKAQWDSHASGA